MAGRIGPSAATALVASVGLLAVFVVGVTTSSAVGSRLAVLPRGPIGEPFRQIWEPHRWEQTYRAFATQEPSIPFLSFSDRRFIVGKDWICNAIVYLRGLHQWIVLGPTELRSAVYQPPGRSASR